MLITEDQKGDNLLMDIRRGELQAVQSSERERRWQATHPPISAALIITPDSPLKAWWDVLMLVCVRTHPQSRARACARHPTPTVLLRAEAVGAQFYSALTAVCLRVIEDACGALRRKGTV